MYLMAGINNTIQKTSQKHYVVIGTYCRRRYSRTSCTVINIVPEFLFYDINKPGTKREIASLARLWTYNAQFRINSQ